jgi:hypothetical protein
MRKFKITTQRRLFGGNEIINESNKLSIQEFECLDYDKNQEFILINEENIEYARKYFNSKYNIGDKHLCVAKNITFIYDNEYENKDVYIWADPYYLLEEYINGVWIIIDKHNCNNNCK